MKLSREFIHQFYLILAGNPWHAHLYWSYWSCSEIVSLPLSSLSPSLQLWVLDAVSPQVSVTLEYHILQGKQPNGVVFCTCISLYFFWFPHFKDQAPKETIWQSLKWTVFWGIGFLHPLTYMKNGRFEPGWLIYLAYFDCCGNMFWTKAVILLWELTGSCLCVMRNKSFSLAYIFEIRLLYSKEDRFCSFFFNLISHY